MQNNRWSRPSRRRIKISPLVFDNIKGSNKQYRNLSSAFLNPAQTLGNPDEETIKMHQQVFDSKQALNQQASDSSLVSHVNNIFKNCGIPHFTGYQVLIQLSQQPDIKTGIEEIANDMLKKWVDFEYSGNANKQASNRIETIKNELDRFKVKKLLQDSVCKCGYLGGCLIAIDTGEDIKDMANPLVYDDAILFKKDSLQGFKIIEPFNVSPGIYNATNPLADDFYKPKGWWVLGNYIHGSRLIHMAQNKLITLLLPSYNFFGISLTQLVMDVVAHFVECREASQRLLTKFSLLGFKTNMGDILFGGKGEDFNNRMNYLVQRKDNDGVIALDKEDEDIVNISTPLTGVTQIVQQAMEMVAAGFSVPVTKLWGISPAGMNATGEHDQDNYYDHVNSRQEAILREPLEVIIKIIQINKFGNIDPNITFKFNELSEEDKQMAATVRETKARTDQILIDAGVVSAEEARRRVINDEESGYNDLTDTVDNSDKVDNIIAEVFRNAN